LEETEATNLEANPEKMEPNPEMLQFEVVYREVPAEETSVKSSGIMKKRKGAGI
jgi:hypothetical protein